MAQIQLKQAKSKEEKEAVYKFRFKVIDAAGTYQPSADYDQEIIKEKTDDRSTIYTSFEDETLTGTFRTFTLDKEDFEFNKQCQIEKWLEVVKAKEISWSSKFFIFGTQRNNRTVISLLKEHYRNINDKKIKIDLICCPEPTLSFYEGIGYRKFTKAFHHPSSPWSLVPMVLFIEDTEYLHKIRSPLFTKDLKPKNNPKLNSFYENNFLPENTTTSAHIQLRRLTNKYAFIFKNEQMKPYVNALRANNFMRGETVYKESEFGSSMHLIVSGTAETEGKDLEAGDFFGEAALLSPRPRNSTVIAKEALETLELDSKDFYSILEEKPHTATAILHLIGEKINE